MIAALCQQLSMQPLAIWRSRAAESGERLAMTLDIPHFHQGLAVWK